MIESAKKSSAKIYTYGIDCESDFKAENIVKNYNGVEYDIVTAKETYHIKVPIPGKFSIYNSLCAFACAYIEGISPKCAIDGLENVFVPGKAENVPTGKDFSVLIDYAHNPDSFENILTTVKEYAKRTIFVFGCGGDRNRPRALMGETAGKFADFTIITSDNPRSENPESIVKDIEKGIIPTGADYICIVDRKQAIEYAIKNAQPGDVIILAGKGHETEQIFADRTVHFDEREIVREILRGIEE
jgi:UDP-N-acetylmuramoyl-L-alanyl-D-glutamate--2,6-diaminopimelate ligase